MPYHILRIKKEEGLVPDLEENTAYWGDRHINEQLHYDVVGAKIESWTATVGMQRRDALHPEETRPRWHRSNI